MISGQGIDNRLKRDRRKGIRYQPWEVNAVNEGWHLDVAGPCVTQEGRKCWVLVGVEA